MSGLAAVALAVVLLHERAGVAVGLRAEQRAGVSDVGRDGSAALFSADPMSAVGGDVMFVPSVRVEDEIGPLRLEGGYAPQMVFRVLSGDPRPLVLHSVQLQGVARARRVQTFGGASLEVGELDFSRAVRELELPGSVPDGTGSLDALPYSAFGVATGAQVTMTRRWTLSAALGGTLSGASAERLRTAFPIMVRPYVEGRTTHRLTRRDTVDLALQLQTVVFSTGTSYLGAQPVLGWTRQLGGTGAATFHAGALFTESTPLPQRPGVFRVHPIADLGISQAATVGGVARAELSVQAGVAPFFDPFTATLDERSLTGLATKVSVGRVSVVTSGMWLMMLNYARPEYGFKYIGGRGDQSDHLGLLDLRVEHRIGGGVSLDAGVSTLVRWDEPTWPQPTNAALETFVRFGLTGALMWPKPPDRREEEG